MEDTKTNADGTGLHLRNSKILRLLMSSIRYKIIIPCALVLIVGISIVCFILYSTLSDYNDKNSRKHLEEIGNKFAGTLSHEFDSVMYFLQTMSVMTKHEVMNGNSDRTKLIELYTDAFANFNGPDAIYCLFEANAFDGRDNEYAGTELGTETGRINFYFIKHDGVIEFDSTSEGGDVEFEDDFYQVAKNTKLPYIIDPYLYPFLDDNDVRFMISFCYPIIDDNGKLLGVLGADLLLDSLRDYMNSEQIYDTGYITAVTSGNVVLNSPVTDDLGEYAEDTPNGESYKQATQTGFSTVKSLVNGKKSLAVSMPIGFEHVSDSFTITISAPLSEIERDSNAMLLMVLYALIIIAVIMPIVIFIVVTKLVKPLIELANLSEKISEGNFDITISSNSRDEIGRLTNNFGRMVYNLNMLISDINEFAMNQEKGMIDSSIDYSKYKGMYQQVAKGSSDMVASYVSMMKDIFNTLENFTNGHFIIDLKQYPGQKAKLNEFMVNFNDNLYNIETEIQNMVKAASDGNLDLRIDPSLYKGEWADIFKQLNALLNAVTEPINEASTVLDEAARGIFNIKMTGNYQGGFRKIKESINTTLDSVSSYIAEITGVLNEIANNNLDTGIEREYIGQFVDIKNSINTIIEHFNTVLTDLSSASKQVSIGAKNISESSANLSNGASHQANSIQMISSAINDVNTQTFDNMTNAKLANELAEKSRTNLRNGSNETDKLLLAMDEINAVSQNMASIVNSIENIAFQTTILAMNASIEAAHAGEKGLGFAVVADEVRRLAAESKEQAVGINILINNTQEKIEIGLITAKNSAKILKTIVDDITKLFKSIELISASSENQVGAIAKLSDEINQINNAITNTTSISEEAAAVSEELVSQFDMLDNMVNIFMLKKEP